jgi:hypothetical protein
MEIPTCTQKLNDTGTTPLSSNSRAKNEDICAVPCATRSERFCLFAMIE